MQNHIFSDSTKPPRLPLLETGAVRLRYLCRFKGSHNYLRGFLMAVWAGAKITERSQQRCAYLLTRYIPKGQLYALFYFTA